MKIYAVEKDGNYPFTGFHSKEAAKNYILKEYVNGYLMDLINEDIRGNNKITREDVQTIQDDLLSLCEEDHIDDYFYIHEIEVLDE